MFKHHRFTVRLLPFFLVTALSGIAGYGLCAGKFVAVADAAGVAETPYGIVEGRAFAHDGSTIKVGERVVVLWGITTHQRTVPAGEFARYEMNRLVYLKRVRCHIVGRTKLLKRDVGVCYTGPNFEEPTDEGLAMDVGARMIFNGYAFAAPPLAEGSGGAAFGYSPPYWLYLTWQSQAMFKGRGLWSAIALGKQ